MSDGSQLRFQLIRTIEKQQILELENYNLRTEISNLKDSSNNFSKINVVQNEKLVSRIRSLQKEISEFKTNITNLRCLLKDSDLERTLNFQQSTSCFRKLSAILTSQNTEIIALKSQLKSSVTRSVEEDKIKKSFDKLSVEYEKLKEKERNSECEVELLRLKIQELTETNSSLTTRIETSEKETRKLRSISSRLENEKSDWINEKEQLLLEKLKLEELLTRSSSDLRERDELILNLQAEIVSLRMELSKHSLPKSHFAKFVEVKTENQQLQSQLDHLSKKLSEVTTESFGGKKLKQGEKQKPDQDSRSNTSHSPRFSFPHPPPSRPIPHQLPRPPAMSDEETESEERLRDREQGVPSSSSSSSSPPIHQNKVERLNTLKDRNLRHSKHKSQTPSNEFFDSKPTSVISKSSSSQSFSSISTPPLLPIPLPTTSFTPAFPDSLETLEREMRVDTNHPPADNRNGDQKSSEGNTRIKQKIENSRNSSKLRV